MDNILEAYCQIGSENIKQLLEAPLRPVADRLTDIYDNKNNKGKGIYAIYEDESLMYIGRTDNISQRMQQHYTTETGARLAKKLNKGGKVKDQGFKKQMDRVKNMSFRFVEIKDPSIQALTEILATIKLKPLYNDLENH